MYEIDLPYLAWPQGRGGVFYPTYRRNDLLRALKTPDGERLKGGKALKKDTRVIAAWLPIHEEFEKDKEAEENRAGNQKHKAPFVYTGSITHAIDGWLDEEVPLLAKGTQSWLKLYSDHSPTSLRTRQGKGGLHRSRRLVYTFWGLNMPE